jgi:glycosyltransferase involved in cell wall biosynthesis
VTAAKRLRSNGQSARQLCMTVEMLSLPASTPRSALPRVPSIAVLTYLTSPYQLELFDALAKSGRCLLDVFYLHTSEPSRSWRRRDPQHRHLVLSNPVQEEAYRRMSEADLAVFNFYNDSRAGVLLKHRVGCERPWCFWGERPRDRYGWLGGLFRRWKLQALLQSHAPVWGIGRYALEQYEHEFGVDRPRHNVPYYSDLARFERVKPAGRQRPGHTRFLFSGALVHRKGIDLLATAFRRLAALRTDVTLAIMGEGNLQGRLQHELRCLGDRVEFLGFRDWDDLPAHYHRADILCVPSRHDGWGLVVPEGLAAGLPVIASTRTGAARDLLRPPTNGWLIPADDELALFAAIAEAAASSDEEIAARSTAAAMSVATHSLDHGVSCFLAAARESLQNWSSGTSQTFTA